MNAEPFDSNVGSPAAERCPTRTARPTGTAWPTRMALSACCAVLVLPLVLAGALRDGGGVTVRASLPGLALASAPPRARSGSSGHGSIAGPAHASGHAYDCRGKPLSPLHVGFLPARFEGAGRPTLVSVTVNAPVAVPDLVVKFLLPPGVALAAGQLEHHETLAAGEMLAVSISVRTVAAGEQWIGAVASSASLGLVGQGALSLTGPLPLELMARPPQDPIAAAIDRRGRDLARAVDDPSVDSAP